MHAHTCAHVHIVPTHIYAFTHAHTHMERNQAGVVAASVTIVERGEGKQSLSLELSRRIPSPELMTFRAQERACLK